MRKMITLLAALFTTSLLANDFAFIGYVDINDIKVEVGDYRGWWDTPRNSYWEMTVKVKGQVEAIYKTHENSSRGFDEDGFLQMKVDKLKSGGVNKVLLLLPHELSRDKFRSPIIRRISKSGIVREKDFYQIMVDPSKEVITFQESGPIYKKDAQIDIFFNGKKIKSLDGPGFHSPTSIMDEEEPIEDVYNNAVLDLAGNKNGRVLMTLYNQGFFMIVPLILEDVE